MNFPCCCGCCTRCGDCGCGETTCAECGCVKAACGGVRCSSLEWFAGVRFLDIGNALNIAVERRENGGVEDGSYNIQTGNHLIGGQLGARLRRTINRFGWEVTGKAGVYANDAEQTQSVIDFPNFPLRPTTSAQGCNTAFVGEINISGIYRLTDIWSAKVGYNAIWVEGLALRPGSTRLQFRREPQRQRTPLQRRLASPRGQRRPRSPLVTTCPRTSLQFFRVGHQLSRAKNQSGS